MISALFDANVIDVSVGLVDRRYDKSSDSWKLYT